MASVVMKRSFDDVDTEPSMRHKKIKIQVNPQFTINPSFNLQLKNCQECKHKHKEIDRLERQLCELKEAFKHMEEMYQSLQFQYNYLFQPNTDFSSSYVN